MDEPHLSGAVLNLLALHGLRAAPALSPHQPFDVLFDKPCGKVLFVGYPQWGLQYWIEVIEYWQRIGIAIILN